jgi:Rps23 Pro-64 3,4-dihydroxylase Tpa1-like proline 4-hydroxylase
METNNLKIITLSSVFTEDFCEKIIHKSESIGFEESLVQMYGKLEERKDIRNNVRIHFNDNDLALDIHKQIDETILNVFTNHTSLDVGGNFRVYKYLKNQRFKRHKDGSTIKNLQKSDLTCLLYLNTLNENEGGETVFYSEMMINGKRDVIKKIHPHVGSIVIFEHQIWHEGLPVLGDNPKYVLRTDIFLD